MFSMISNLTKAVVSVAVAPVMVVADICTLPGDIDSNDEFKRTSDVLSNAGKCLDKALDPRK